jgi:hypothetical protein
VSANGNGNGAAPHVDESAATSVMLVPISGAEAVSMFAASVAFDALQPFVTALGVTGFEGYARVLESVYQRWLAETARPAREREAQT